MIPGRAPVRAGLLRLATLLCAFGVLLSSGCGPTGAGAGGSAFSLSFRERDGKPLSQIHSNARSAARTAAVPLAVGVTDREVIGQPLDGSSGWRSALAPVQEPLVEGTVVVVPTQAELVALDARSGVVLWRIPSAGQPVFGVDDDGKRTVVTHGRAPTVVQVIDRDGTTLMKLEAPHLLGAPAVRGPYVFVPWRDQFVSAFEVATGEEVGRLVLPRQVSQAVVFGDDLYFGEDALLRFDKEVAAGGPERGVWLTANAEGLPGTPRWFQRGVRSEPLPLRANAFARLFALPTGDTLERRVFATSYFRIAMGFDADTRALLWVITLPRPIVGGAAVAGGFVFCSSDGNLVEVASLDGAVRQVATLGGTLRACPVGAGDHRVINGAGEVLPHHEQLSQAVLLVDPQMAAAQVFLLQQMGNLTEPSLSETLIRLLSRSHAPPELLHEARTLLATRRTGAEHMLAALKRPYDFLAGRESLPPVGPIAVALSALNEPEAAPLLAAHLNDPVYDPESVRQVALALQTLARREQIPELRRFFTLNHATVDSQPLADAVNASADALLAMGDRESQLLIQAAARSDMTHPGVRSHIEERFDWNGSAPLAPADGDETPKPPSAQPRKP